MKTTFTRAIYKTQAIILQSLIQIGAEVLKLESEMDKEFLRPKLG